MKSNKEKHDVPAKKPIRRTRNKKSGSIQPSSDLPERGMTSAVPDEGVKSGSWAETPLPNLPGRESSPSILEILGLSQVATACPGPAGSGVLPTDFVLDPVRHRSIGPASSSGSRGQRLGGMWGAIAPGQGRKAAPRIGSLVAGLKAGLKAEYMNRLTMMDCDAFGVRDLDTQVKASMRLIDRLLEPECQLHPDKQPDETWCPMSETLARMPHRYRRKAFGLAELGVAVFGKVPIITGTDDAGGFIACVAGPPRPMGCPEKAPDGTEFILAWRLGNWWNWDLPLHSADTSYLDPPVLNPRLFEAEFLKSVMLLASCAEHAGGIETKRAIDILDAIDFRPGREYDTSFRAQGTAFQAGVQFAAGILFAQPRYLMFHPKGDLDSSGWTEIISHAFDRHGRDLTANKILEKLGERRSNTASKNESRNDDSLFSEEFALMKRVSRKWLVGIINDVKRKAHQRRPGMDKLSTQAVLRETLARPRKKADE